MVRALFGGIAQHRQKFVAAKADDGVGGAEGALQHLRHLHQDAIAGQVPELGVRGLEVVNVNHEEAQLDAVAFGAAQVLGDHLVHVAAVESIGEWIHQRQPLGSLVVNHLQHQLFAGLAQLAALAQHIDVEQDHQRDQPVA